MSEQLKVNHEYKCARYPEVSYKIFYKSKNGERPFYGISNDGIITTFDSRGYDEFFMCGGNWWRLDLSSAKEIKSIFNWNEGLNE